MPTTDESQSNLDVIAKLEESANGVDPSIAASVIWLEDPRFSEIEDSIPQPFGAETVRGIHDWIRENGQPGDNVRFTDIKVHLLSPEIAYATCIQELNFDTPSESRVTFLFLKQGGNWGVLRAYYSSMPPG